MDRCATGGRIQNHLHSLDAEWRRFLLASLNIIPGQQGSAGQRNPKLAAEKRVERTRWQASTRPSELDVRRSETVPRWKADPGRAREPVLISSFNLRFRGS